MKRPHPASSILLGLIAILAVSARDGTVLLLASLFLILAALITSKRHFGLLIRRSRWLLLTLLILFGWLTPGTPMPGIPGASQEGLLLAAENLGRLLVALSVVAVLLTALSPVELVAGLRSLLLPLTLLGIPRDRIAVRLALTLEEVEAARLGRSAEPADIPSRLVLPAAKFGVTDMLLLGFVLILLVLLAAT